MASKKTHKFSLIVLCGGPSMERGISLNSCRSVCDNLESPDIDIQPIYFDYRKQAYAISRGALYSNTPSDFDFKLQNGGKKLSKRALISLFKKADLVFPAIHGAFGEDGQIQSILEKAKARYVGSPSHACKVAFNKYKSNELINAHDFPSLPSALLKSHLSKKENHHTLETFFKKNHLTRAIVKPVSGGSSIGVHSVTTAREALEAMIDIFNKKLDTQAVCEPFCEGKEFTVVILQNRFGLPVALIPSEIETSYKENQIFDFRKKYLPTRKVKYHCPPRFTQDQVEKIQTMAEQLFSVLGMRHFGRFDGWLLKDGKIWFSDFNPISGMEQNSFLFQQASQVGFTHRDVLMYILRRAATEYGLALPESADKNAQKNLLKKEPVNVIGGGTSAERQVSLMSATNIWLKLKRSHTYDPQLYIMTGDDEIWHTPYNFALNHTVEEIASMLRDAEKNADWLETHRNQVLLKLALRAGEASEKLFQPRKITLKEFLNLDGFVFLGLHGGMGEDGTIQKLLTQHHKKFNGSHAQASHLCMDKFATGEAMKPLAKYGIYTAEKKVFPITHFKNFTTQKQWEDFWTSLKYTVAQAKVGPIPTHSLIIKPTDDGCSAGICRISTATDLKTYLEFAEKNALEIPANTLEDQHGIIEMPSQKMHHILLERFIETDKPRVINNKLIWNKKTNWIEVTVGVIGHAKKMHALSPSLTVSHSHVLSLEEKFQGGTGVNITPPPAPHVTKKALTEAKKRIEIAANTLGIEGYARLDAFMHTQTGNIIIIEANTLPALTPSTVIFHQALEEPIPTYPREFLEHLITLGKTAQ